MRRWAREKQEKRKNWRPILESMRAALLRSLKGQHCKKMVCIRRVPTLTGTLGKAGSHFDLAQAWSGTASTL